MPLITRFYGGRELEKAKRSYKSKVSNYANWISIYYCLDQKVHEINSKENDGSEYESQFM